MWIPLRIKEAVELGRHRHRIKQIDRACEPASTNGSKPGEHPMIRHGINQRSAAGAQPSAMGPRVSMIIADVDRTAPSRPLSRQHRAEAPRSGLPASNSVPPGDAPAIAERWPPSIPIGSSRKQ